MAEDRGTVLLVEDETLIAFEAEDMLTDLGFSEVVVCPSFKRAEETIAGRDFSIGVFDLNLDGQLSTPLVKAFTAKGGCAVLATGYDLEPGFAEELGAIYLLKPYSVETLRTAIGLATAQREAAE